MIMHNILAWEYWPVLNFLMLASGGAFLLVRGPKWTGPVQAVMIAALGGELTRFQDRIGQLEANTSIRFEDMTAALDGLRAEIRKLSSKVGHAGALNGKIGDLQSAQADSDQQLQFFKDLGCGHPECPRNQTVKE